MNRYTPTMIWLVICLLLVLFKSWGCSPYSSPVLVIGDVPIARIPTKITSYPLKDYKGELHKYRDNFDSFIFPRDNKKLTQYCAFHFQWEDIKAVYGKGEDGQWRYSYIVTRNKKQ